jgi:hypothetical protein
MFKTAGETDRIIDLMNKFAVRSLLRQGTKTAQQVLQHDHRSGSSFYQASGHNSQVYDP